MAEDAKSPWAGLLGVAKIFGAVATIVGVLAAGGSWIFTAVMAERDEQVHTLQTDIAHLNDVITQLNAQLAASQEQFTNMRIAVELLNARLELRTSPAGQPAAVHVRVRPEPPRPGIPVIAVAGGVHEEPNAGVPLLFPHAPPPPQERVFTSDHEAEAAFDRAIADVGAAP